MNRHLSTWTVASVLALLAVAVAQADEPIIFSKPSSSATEKPTPAAEPLAHTMSGSHSTTTSLFGGKTRGDFDVLPGYQPPPPLSPAQVKELQKNYDQQKNWTLMTPAEILGVPTPAQILGIPDPDQNLSAEDRYFKRQNRQRSAAATNALAYAGRLGGQDDGPFQSWRSGQENNSNDRFGNGNRQNRTDRFGTRNATGAAEDLTHRPDSPWSSAFDVPPTLPKPDKSQMAAMERFRAMMQPTEPDKLLTPLPTLGNPSMPVASTPSPNFQRLEHFNPGGNSYRPVQDTMNRPIGITPLPTTTGVRPMQVNQPKPKPLTEPPPWVAEQNNQNNYSTPKPGVFSQRKF